jgi:hypothetical protein
LGFPGLKLHRKCGRTALTTITGVLKGDKLMENKAAKFSDLSAA